MGAPMRGLVERFRRPSVGRLRLSSEWTGEPTNFQPRWERPGINRTAFEFLPVFDHAALHRLEQVLNTEDEPCLKRGRRITQEGAHDRFRTWFPVRMRAIRARELANLGLDEHLTEERDDEQD